MAAQRWHEEFTKTLRDAGFRVGRSSPCIFHREEKHLRIMFHGDDFITL